MPVQQLPNDSIDTKAGMMMTRDGGHVPLLAVDINVSVHDAVSHLTLQQVYRNDEKVPIEAVYSFPIGEMSVLHRLEIRVGDRVVRASIDEKERAMATYDEALSAGNRAILVDQDRPNILTLSLGNLLPGEEAVVTIGTASELERNGDNLRLLIPTTISPRYIPAGQAATLDPAELIALLPPLRSQVPYGLSLRAEIRGSSPVREVECVSHPVRTELVDGGAVVTLVDRKTALDQDVVMNIRFDAAPRASVLVGRDGETECIAALEFRPDPGSFRREPREVVFLIDRSGSMEGESIQQARDTLNICLRSLVEGDFFNIVGFGSEFESLFETSVPYNQESLDTATRHVGAMEADLGGTEMLEPLVAILGRKSLARRRVVLVTDGEVSNEDEIAALVRHHPDTAIFTFGIGRGVNEHLARLVARSSGGAAEFVFPGERIEEKVMRQFGRITGPILADVTIDFEGAVPDLVTPARLAPISGESVVRIYARFPRARKVRATLQAVGPTGPISWTQEFDTGQAGDMPALPALLARAAIREMEEDRVDRHDQPRSRRSMHRDKATIPGIVTLSCRYGVLSSETSFIGVQVIDNPNPDIQPEFRQVPIALTRGWGGMDMPDATFGPAMSSVMMVSEPVGLLSLKSRSRGAMPRSRTAAATDPVMELVALQQADGSWKLDAAFNKMTSGNSKALSALVRQIPVDKQLAARIVATLVALRYLAEHPDREAEWRYLAQKARTWLAALSVKPPQGGGLEAWLDIALPKN